MKPKARSRSNHAPLEARIPSERLTGNYRNQIIFGSIAALGLAGLASAQTAYTVIPAGSPLDWNTDANWTPFTALAYPGTVAGDSALVTGDFGGAAKVVNLSATPANPLVALTLGDTNLAPGATTVSADALMSLPLNIATITSGGTLGAVNSISAPIVQTGNLTFGATSTNPLAVSGKITPSVAGNRSIVNASLNTVTLGDIDLSMDVTTSVLSIQNQNNSALNRINLHGVIANGSSVAAALTLEGRVNNTIIEVGNETTNTYTGATILQSNGGGGRTTFFRLNGTDPFGTGASGTLTVGQPSNTICVFDAIGSARIIANPTVVLARGTTFQGSNSITFSGTVTTGSSHNLINNMSGGGQLNFTGRYNLDNSSTVVGPPAAGNSDSRMRTFAGTGTTVFTGIVADHAVPTPDMFGGVNVTGTGTVIIENTATFQGGARVTGAGTLQIGNGAATGAIVPDFPNLSHDDFTIVLGIPTITDPLDFPAFVKKSVVTGGTTGTGSFAVKRSDAIPLAQTLNGPVGLKQIGSGVLTVATPQFNSGANQVGDGVSPSELVVTAAASGETTQNGDFGAPAVHGAGYNVFYQTVSNLTDTSLLTIGQPAYITTPSGAIYIHSIDSPSQVTLIGTGITSASTGLIAGQNLSGPVFGQAIKFGAGSSLGTSAATTTVKALSTLSGTGEISGSVAVEGILEPGASVGTLTTGNLTLASGSTLAVELDTTAVTADKVVVNGNVVSNGGTVTLTLTDLGGDVALPNGTKFTLVDYTGTWTGTTALTYAGNPVANNTNITLGANTYIVNYIDPAVDGTALTLTVGTAVATPFETWVDGFSGQLPNPLDRLASADPDHDSSSNNLEFALNGNPASGSDNGKMVVSTEDTGDVDADRELSITLAVRNGAVLGAGPGGSATLTVDGIVYTIQGSATLLAWDKAIGEVTPASVLVPAPDAAWEARTFKVTDSTGLPDKRFIRVGVE